MRFSPVFFALGCTLLFAPGAAFANGRFPAANQVVVAPKDPGFLVLRTTFGVLISYDAGHNWDWICEASVGYGGTEDPSMGITGGSAILAGTFEGLSTTQDRGCSWSQIPGQLSQNVVVDVVVRPDTPSTAFVITNKFDRVNDGGATLFASNVFRSTDDGKSWTVAGPPLDPSILFETIEVAASDPQRFYVSGVRGSGPDEKGVVLVSSDGAQTWEQYPFPLNTQFDRAPFISAVDPNNPDRVYARTKGNAGSRLFVSDDGAKTFREVLTMTGDMLGFALSPDGKKVWVGGPKDGLLVANATDLAFTKKSSIAVSCLGVSGPTLYACATEVDGFIFGASDDDGATFAPKLHLWSVRGPLACGANATQAQCVPQWPSLKESLGTPPSDGGVDVADGGESSGGGGSSSGGGCAVEASPGSDAAPLGVLLSGLGLALLRRKRRATT